MIKELILENVSFFQDARVSFKNGFNVITGETGAGKTLLINTLLLLLGEKTEYEGAKAKETNGSITGVFELSEEVIDELHSIEIEVENPVIIRRMIKKDGKTSAYLNDSPISISMLKRMGNVLFDIHGQHEHQFLLKKEFHIKVIDRMAENEELLSEYKDILSEYLSKESEYKRLSAEAASAEKEREFLEYSYRELISIELDAIDEDDIFERLKEMENVEEIKIKLNEAIMLLSANEERSLNVMAVQLKKIIADTVRKSKKLENLNKSCEELVLQISDIEEEAGSIIENIFYDENELNRLRKIIDDLERMKKKYGTSIEGLIKLRNDTEKRLKIAQNPQEALMQIKLDAERLHKELDGIAKELHAKREKTSKKLESEVNKSLKDVNMADSEIFVRIEFDIKNMGDDGFDEIEIYMKNRFSPEGMPLRKIASGGEISRVMLSIKQSLSKKDPVETMIFDEIDQGISGQTAEMVGKAMYKASIDKQIIAITHLPQIASKGDNHIIVEKKKISIELREIEGAEREKEIARLLGSSVSEDTALKHARALLKR